MDQIIQQMNRGTFKGKWFCHRNGGMEYLHADGSWQMIAHYFESEEEIEELLTQPA